MRSRQRKIIQPRRRVFLGCEGESERGYGALLGQLLESQRHDVHLDVVLLQPGGGDPLSLVKLAKSRIIAAERKRRLTSFARFCSTMTSWRRFRSVIVH